MVQIGDLSTVIMMNHEAAKIPHPAKGGGLANEAVTINRNKSLMDDEDDDGDDDPYDDLFEDGYDTNCPELCPPSPYHALTALPSPGERVVPEDALALEVGHTAFKYLEECFHYTEVSVLDRDKFNAITEIVKSDFTITVSAHPHVMNYH